MRRILVTKKTYNSRLIINWITISYLFFLCLKLNAQNYQIPIQFTLKSEANTSAGIFSKDSILIRTLWSNVKYQAGIHSYLWDREDDNGKIVLDSSVQFRILTNNVKYEWEGAFIGNTSDSMIGSSKHRYFSRPNSMAIFGNYAYYSTGYEEGIPSCYKFDVTRPQNKINILDGPYGDVDQMGLFTASDGVNVYWAGIDPFNIKNSFVYATSIKNDKETVFLNGYKLNMTYGRTYTSVINLIANNDSGIPSGMAVQKNGIYLFVAHANLNELHVINKTTGALVQNISINSPRQLCVDMNDNLWMISGTNSVQKFTVNSNGTLSSPILSINNLDEPLAFAVSPNNYIIAISDGGNSQQVKAFDNSTGSPVWTLGQYGGYTNSPLVTNDKFMFSHAATKLKGSFICFQADSSFWVGDPGNERLQHYSSNQTFIDYISSMPASYCVNADLNDPTRVFNEYLEFKIDYSKTLAPNNGSWVLIRNWRAGVTANYFPSFSLHAFKNILTLSNGKTYGIMQDNTNPSWPIPEVVELPSTGHLRYTGVTFKPFENFVIEKDGSVRTLIADGTVGKVGYWETRTLTGFSNQNNPIWAAANTIAYTPKGVIEDPLNDANASPIKTTSDMLICFNKWGIGNNGKGTGYHLGAIKKGTNKWKWLACKATSKSYLGPMPTDGTFDQGNGVVYPGGDVYGLDNNIFWNYHGEFWKNAQTNIWNQYNEDGLMIGQFGITSEEGLRYNKEAFAMGAGNVFSSSIVKVGSDYYIYHNDESVHAGVHRWKISGLNTISEQSSNISIRNNIGGLRLNIYDGKNLDNLLLKSSFISKHISIENAPNEINDSLDYSGQFSGLMKIDSNGLYQTSILATGGVKVWLNSELLISEWNNRKEKTFLSKKLELKADTFYPIRIEFTGGKLKFKVLENMNTTRPIYMADSLSTYNDWVDLFENIPQHKTLENLYGWVISPEKNDTNTNDYWLARTKIKTYKKEDNDILLQYHKSSGKAIVERNLNTDSKCKGSWSILAKFNFEYNSPNDGETGFYIDILDNVNKTICRITEEFVFSNSNFPSLYSINLNGENVVNEEYKNLIKTLNFATNYLIKVENKKVYLQVGNYIPVSCQIYDSSADWASPGKITFNFIGSSNNHRREFDISGLWFNGKRKPILTTINKDTSCENIPKLLGTNNSNYYKWSTGETSQNIKVNKTGKYTVSASKDNICFEKSGTFFQYFHSLPNPILTRIGDTLKSNYKQGNSWYFDNKIIQNEKQSLLKISQKGTYRLVTIDSNSCVGHSENIDAYSLNVNIENSDTIVIYPNPNKGVLNFLNLPKECQSIKIFTNKGDLIQEYNCQEAIDLKNLSSGIYNIVLTSTKNTTSKILILN